MYFLNEYDCNLEFDEKMVITLIAKVIGKIVDLEGFRVEVSCMIAHIKQLEQRSCEYEDQQQRFAVF